MRKEGADFYIIQSQKHGRFYIGSCIEVSQRIADHNRGNTYSTRGQGPWILVYTEHFDTLPEARSRERQVKRWKSRKMIEELIANTKIR